MNDIIKELREYVGKINVHGSHYMKKWIKEEFSEKIDELEKEDLKDKKNLICFLDGDALCIVKKNFLNIQKDSSVFIKLGKRDIKDIEELARDYKPEVKNEG